MAPIANLDLWQSGRTVLHYIDSTINFHCSVAFELTAWCVNGFYGAKCGKKIKCKHSKEDCHVKQCQVPGKTSK